MISSVEGFWSHSKDIRCQSESRTPSAVLVRLIVDILH